MEVPPSDVAGGGWAPDPSAVISDAGGMGLRWTEHVSADEAVGFDPPLH